MPKISEISVEVKWKIHFGFFWPEYLGLPSIGLPKFAFLFLTNRFTALLLLCTNTRHRIALTKRRLSNHKLAIETGRYSRPFKKPAERTCPICKIEMEDEYHFLNICPAYQEKRSSLLDYLENEYRIKISRMSPNRIFMFLINPPSGDVRLQKLIAKHIFECFEKRKGEDGKV